jgi:hypothetical protein
LTSKLEYLNYFQVDKVSGRTMEKLVKAIDDILKKAYSENDNKDISYIKFAFNPHSFTKTVENIFHIAFLVNNAKASIFLGKIN